MPGKGLLPFCPPLQMHPGLPWSLRKPTCCLGLPDAWDVHHWPLALVLACPTVVVVVVGLLWLKA
eukprot:21272-Chlamydomonas_euryale.AAC.1